MLLHCILGLSCFQLFLYAQSLCFVMGLIEFAWSKLGGEGTLFNICINPVRLPFVFVCQHPEHSKNGCFLLLLCHLLTNMDLSFSSGN